MVKRDGTETRMYSYYHMLLFFLILNTPGSNIAIFDSNVGDTVILFLKTNEGSILGDSYRINCSVFGRYTLNKDSYIRPEFIVENDNPEKITTYSNMDTFEFRCLNQCLKINSQQ